MNFLPTLIASGFAASMLVIQHYAILPKWREIYRQDLPPLVRYVLGTLAVCGSLTIKFALEGNWQHALDTIIVVTASGLAVFAIYYFDYFARNYAKAIDLAKLGQRK